MKVVITGGGTGGHFYPLIAVVEELRAYAKENKFIEPTFSYFSHDPYNARLLFDYHIDFKHIPAGKRNDETIPQSIKAHIVNVVGFVIALLKLFVVFPDVVFSKGGYSSIPTVLAARFLGIPIVIHESDSVPGRANVWASAFATKIAVSFPTAVDKFPAKAKNKIAWTGHPIRREILHPNKDGAFEFLDLERSIPSILVLGGSQGALRINEAIIDALPKLLPKTQVIHQTGKIHYETIKGMADVAIQDPILRRRYRPFEYLDDIAMTMAAGAAKVVITRAGSTLFEIAAWGIPAVIIPIRESSNDHQRSNAFYYAHAGAGVVIEENNLSDEVLTNEIFKIIDNPTVYDAMSAAAKSFHNPEAARTIAKELMTIILSHE